MRLFDSAQKRKAGEGDERLICHLFATLVTCSDPRNRSGVSQTTYGSYGLEKHNMSPYCSCGAPESCCVKATLRGEMLVSSQSSTAVRKK